MKCPALGCNNDHRLHKNLMWHRFPLRRPLLLAKWTVRLKAGINFEHRRLCAQHFRRECYVPTNDEQKPEKLKRNAFPTLFEGEQIEDSYLLDESQANVEDKTVPPTTVRKRDIPEYKKKKELQQRQQLGAADDGNMDLDGNLTYHHNDEVDADDDDNLLLGDIKLGHSPLLQSTDSPSQALHHLHRNEPLTRDALLSMANYEPPSADHQANAGSESFFNALNDQFSPPQERQNNFLPQQDVKDWAEQFMAGTLGTNDGAAQQLTEPSVKSSLSVSAPSRSTRGENGQQLTGAAKRKAATVTRLGTANSSSTRSASSDAASSSTTQPKSSSSSTLVPPHMKKTNSVSSNSGSSSPNSPLSTAANGAAVSAGGDAEMSNFLHTFDMPASNAGGGKSAAHALANAIMQHPSIAASFGTQLVSAIVSANSHSGSINSASAASSNIATPIHHYAGRQNQITTTTTAVEQAPPPPPPPSKSSGKRKSNAANLQQSRQPKTLAVQNPQNEMMPPMYNSGAVLNNNSAVMTRAVPGNNMQLAQQVYSVLLNSMPSGFHSNSSNNRPMPNLHALANNLASVVTQNNNNTGQFGGYSGLQQGSSAGGADRRELERLSREVDTLRRELAQKDVELREIRSSTGAGGKQPAFALIPLGANNVSLVSLARFLRSCGGNSNIANGENDPGAGDDSADDNQFEIQEMQCPVTMPNHSSSAMNGNCSTNTISGGFHRGMHGPNGSNGFHNSNMQQQHFMMPSSMLGNEQQHTLIGYEIKH